MRILLAVVDDLFQFARTALFGALLVRSQNAENRPLFVQDPSLQLPLPTFQSISDVLTRSKQKADALSFVQGGEQYFIGEEEALLYVDPVVSFDTVIRKLPYGELVFVQKLGGRWACIKASEDEGWILKDLLREQATDVFPTFQERTVYDAGNPETKKLRLYIKDQFNAGDAGMALTDAEYVTYKLAKRGQNPIPWKNERPRTQGTWQKKLRGLNGIHIGILPKTDSVMEYVIDDQGHLCYVEAVFPDDSIQLSSIGLYAEGEFVKTMLQKEEWRELRPVFISIT